MSHAPKNHFVRLNFHSGTILRSRFRFIQEFFLAEFNFTMGSSTPLVPTFCGHIASTQDALVLFEACLSGALNHVARRPHDRERSSLIKSGNVFIYEEHSSGIKRWTDGVPWSPSRILGNFLVYRELERPFPPGEKKRAMKRSKRPPGVSKAPEPYGRAGNEMSTGFNAASVIASSYDSASSNSPLNEETERSLIGSLVDSYGFKDEGLVKKTVSVTVGGVSHHLVSYYTVADVMNNKFSPPSKDPRFQHITPRPDLITKQNFRTPIDEKDILDRIDERPTYAPFPYSRSGYEMTNQTISHRPMSLPTPPTSYAQSPDLYSNYAMSHTPGLYSDNPASSLPGAGYNSQFHPAPGVYSTLKLESNDHEGYRRYGPAVNPVSDHRSQPIVASGYPRRSSVIEHGSSIDSGVSTESNDSGYSSQGYYGSLRDGSNTSPHYEALRSLPTPSIQPGYERMASQPYANTDSLRLKENVWPAGNSSAGHAHYVVPQQNWGNTS